MQGVGAMRGLTQGPGPFARFLKRLNKSWHGYVFIAPAMTIIIVFAYIAMIFSLYVSFHRWDIINPEKPFVGFDHYLHALDNKTLWNAFKNTAYFTFVAVPIITVFSLCLALWAHWAPKGRGFFRTVYFIPTITPMVVVALIWLWIYSPNGPFSRLLELLSISPPNWLNSMGWAMPAVIFMTIWAAVGYFMIIFIAGREDIPPVYYDAAKVDGATSWQQFWNVTLPLMRNSVAFVWVILTIGSWQVFTQMFVLTRGGPNRATESVQQIIYQVAFQNFRMGRAAAISWFLFAVIFVFTVFQLKLYRSRQLY